MAKRPASKRWKPSRRLLLCNACRRVIAVSPADQLKYTRQGWPRCCGEVMTLFTEGEQPSPDTKPDTPTLPPG